MTQLKRLITGVILFIFTVPAGTMVAQSPVLIHNEEFKKDAVVAIDSLYNRNAEASRQIMAPWSSRYPDHPIWTMWDAMEIWWDVLEDLYDHSMDEQLIGAMQRSDYEAGQLLRQQPNHPDALIIRALANGYIARHYSNRDSWLSSVNTARKAYSTYSTFMEVEPGFADNEFVQGMISYYAAYIPEEYPVVRAVSWFLPDGDRREGLARIKKAAEEGIFSRPEATYFAGNILLNYENEYEEAMTYFQRLISDYPDNGYYRRLVIRTLSSQNRNEEVLKEVKRAILYLENNNPDNRQVLLEELKFWEGRALYRMNQFEPSLAAFEQAILFGNELPNRAERLYYSVANYYAGLASEALQNTEEARKYYTVTVNQEVEGDFKSRAKQRLKEL